MAKVAGRKVKIYKGTGGGAVLVAGARADSITINNEPIDITDKGDDGWRTLLNDASVRSVEDALHRSIPTYSIPRNAELIRNLMIAAQRRAQPPDPAPLRERLRELLAFYGIREQHLARLLTV